MAITAKGADRRKARVRKALKARAFGRPRLSVFRSDKNIYAQIIDKDLRSGLKSGSTAEAAASVGKAIAERGVKAGVGEVVFDRGAYIYHGRVKALADAAREGGLQF
jgi:large subunit ribosomal protein L18